MARPAKSIKTATGARTKDEKDYREEVEENLRGDAAPVCPEWLSDGQRAIFQEISDFYEKKDILSALDGPSLAEFCVAVDRLQEIEALINMDPANMTDRGLMSARKQYEATMWRGCSEFCLSPQSRAKIGSLAMAQRKEEKDPLAEVLSLD